MPEPKKKRADVTRQAILGAAEATFAEHGFDGARVDTIAELSGYNKTLLFRYFGDKLGLYTAVLERADREWSELIARSFASLLEDETIVSDTRKFKAFLETTFGFIFDYMVEHPHFTRILNWEQAEGWLTFAKIASHFEPNDVPRLEGIFSQARRAGLLRPGLDVIVMILLVQQVCTSFPPALPMYQMLLAGKKLSTTPLLYARKQIIEILVAGTMHG